MKKKLTLVISAAVAAIALIAGIVIGTDLLSNPPAGTDSPTDTTAVSQPPAKEGAVCVLNTNPDRQSAWQALADAYTAETGVKVQIVSDTSRERPTLLNVSPGEALPENCLDLSPSGAYTQLADLELALRDEQGRVLAVASEVEVFGLVYNSTLLAKTGHTRGDISSFEDLTEVVYGIADDQEKLGFGAFAPVDPEGRFVALLASMPTDCRNLVDLILNTGAKTAEAEENAPLHGFLEGKAVFLPAGSGEHDTLNAIGSENLGVLPVYTGGENEENQTLCVSAAGYWCIDAGAPEEDVRATVEFLNYLTRPREDGSVPVDGLSCMSPYRQAAYVSNMLESVLRYELAMGKKPVVCRPVTQVPQALAQAVAAYAEDPSDDHWAAIVALLDP